MMISYNAKKYATQDGRKPTLFGHSAGGTVGLCYAKDCSAEHFFDRILLFNAPLICPDPRVIFALQEAYVGAQRITSNVTLTMSKFDDVIMDWKIGNFTMTDAIEAVQKLGKDHVRVIVNTTDPNYKHSPFDHVTVAWDTLNSSVADEK
jgi:pimeloyl-ACP methyl ester carboxylesterase